MTTIATTIYNQLGGNRFATMTGAKHFGADGARLSFHLPVHMCKNKAKYCTIILGNNDLYTVKFQKEQGGKFGSIVDVSIHSDVYADNLQSLFTEQTGLLTHL